MASGLGQHISSGYIEITNGSTYATAAKVVAYVSQSIDRTARTVTITVTGTLALYRTRGNWTLSSGSTIYGSELDSNYMTVRIDGSDSTLSGGAWGISAATNFTAVTNGTYTNPDGYVTGWPGRNWTKSYSRTFSYNDSGSAITKSWKVSLKLYSPVAGNPTITVEGTVTTDSISASYTKPSLANATITNKVLGPYHLVSSISGVNYGTNYSNTKLTCRASYTLDNVSYSNDIQSWTSGVTSATCNIDGPALNSDAPWEILPDGSDVNIMWIAESSGNAGSGSTSKTQVSSMPYAYSAYVIDPPLLGASRTWTVIDDNKMLGTYNLETILGYVQETYPTITGDFDLTLTRTADTNLYSLVLHTSQETIIIFEEQTQLLTLNWLSSNFGTSIQQFISDSSYYVRDTFVRFSYHLSTITPSDLKVSPSASAQPNKWVRRLDIVYPPEEPFKGWGYLYVGDTDNEEDWVELNLSQEDFERLCTNKSYVQVGGRKFDKRLVRAISFGPNVTEIGSFFLRDCVNLNYDLVLPDTCLTIGDYFLSGCTSFNSHLGIGKVSTIGNFFLQDCTSFNQPLDIDPARTVGMGFMKGCSTFNQDFVIARLNTRGIYFMHNCDDFSSKLTIGFSGKNRFRTPSVDINDSTRVVYHKTALAPGKYVVSFNVDSYDLGSNENFSVYMNFVDANNAAIRDVAIATINSSTVEGQRMQYVFTLDSESSGSNNSNIRIPVTYYDNGARVKLSDIQIEAENKVIVTDGTYTSEGFGITWVRKTNTITGNGTFDSTSYTYTRLMDKQWCDIPAGTYTFSVGAALDKRLEIIYTYVDGTTLNKKLPIGDTSMSVTLAKDVRQYRLTLMDMTNGEQLSNYIISNVKMVPTSGTLTSTYYEPYTGGAATNKSYVADIYSYSTEDATASIYLNGVELRGTPYQIQSFETAYPARNESPYRWFYSESEAEALTAQEYDDLQLTSSGYDNRRLTVQQYDTQGKTILTN